MTISLFETQIWKLYNFIKTRGLPPAQGLVHSLYPECLQMNFLFFPLVLGLLLEASSEGKLSKLFGSCLPPCLEKSCVGILDKMNKLSTLYTSGGTSWLTHSQLQKCPRHQFRRTFLFKFEEGVRIWEKHFFFFSFEFKPEAPLYSVCVNDTFKTWIIRRKKRWS